MFHYWGWCQMSNHKLLFFFLIITKQTVSMLEFAGGDLKLITHILAKFELCMRICANFCPFRCSISFFPSRCSHFLELGYSSNKACMAWLTILTVNLILEVE